ncbi:hypothetical protein EKE94_09975 [Mesobaculum littorinae]|uniref:Inositolphosphotransferase Aur1/Ipt1 domain-containing protein n=1 Tax=Mesobaculum littorinae TaxID=2486419 RepID=A0A438AGF9_9RHOB|nr:phosphatase PAP2 family protein [Mesobaculum littorinae]RVV97803.1 hypothetical protein EKE94_09975 [Mesobaculum littorinae]
MIQRFVEMEISREDNSGVRLFLTLVALYCAGGAIFVVAVRDGAPGLLRQLALSVPEVMTYFLVQGWWVAPVILLLILLPSVAMSWSRVLARLPGAVAMLAGCAAFFLTFSLVKQSLPLAVPFWADAVLADLDRALHFGHPPWSWTHAALAGLPTAPMVFTYSTLWLVPAMYFPVLLGLLDGDPWRRRRYILLYLFAWVGLGNLVAGAVMSAGPVFYDKLLTGDRFAGLSDGVRALSRDAGGIGGLQEALWQSYAAGAPSLGGGISAFPSVHLAMATVVGLYLAERMPRLLWPALALIAWYQVLSVHLGWHYAVDGYASILAVAALCAWLWRRDLRRGRIAAGGPGPLRVRQGVPAEPATGRLD